MVCLELRDVLGHRNLRAKTGKVPNWKESATLEDGLVEPVETEG